MTGTTETTAPANMLAGSAKHYLNDLEQAARLAQANRDQARTAVRQHELTGPAHQFGANRGEGSAMNAPSDVIANRQYQILTDALHAAESNVEMAADWFARAAIAACRAVLAGEQVTAQQLEQKTLMRNGGWRNEDDAPLTIPKLGDLDTGHQVLDRPVHKAQAPLDVAYRAAVVAENLAELEEQRADDDGGPSGLTDWESAELHDALDGARPFSDLLIAWASAVAHAAVYGRSIAYGHRPAE